VQEIDTSKAHPARMYDFLLGGTDHFEADREAIAGLLKAVPNARTGARENRAVLVASQTTADFADPGQAAAGVSAVQRAGVPFRTRTAAEFSEVAFAGLELVPPGLVAVAEWRPQETGAPRPLPAEVAYYGAVGRKPRGGAARA
jgi:hypothetical protein